jgi:hypothetical protein
MVSIGSGSRATSGISAAGAVGGCSLGGHDHRSSGDDREAVSDL